MALVPVVGGNMVEVFRSTEREVARPAGAWAPSLAARLGGIRAWMARGERASLCPTLVIGGGPLAEECARLVRDGAAAGLAFVGLVASAGEAAPPGLEALGGPHDLPRICAAHEVGLIVVAAGERRGSLPLEALLESQIAGVRIEEGWAFHERVTGRVFLPALRPSHVLFSGHRTRAALAAKRVIDVVVAAVGLVLALPLLVLAAIAIKLDSAGPVFYAQVRTGARGATFSIKKLRTMRDGAEEAGAVWATAGDPRVTRVGAFLRRTRIDEIPQLWNVIGGEMSLVGPRPERPCFVTELTRQIPLYRQRLVVKPGVTGLAQVRFRYGASVEDARMKLAWDLGYVRRWSLGMDLGILLATVKVVLRGGGR